MTKHVLITGGVVGVVPASSIGEVLKVCGLRVTSIKIDPYLNTDAGTMSPFEHGEVFVLDDDGEVDLDLGNYERFLDIKLTRDSNITTGKIYQSVIEKERRGDYLGNTVQVVPHVIMDEIKRRIQLEISSVPVDGQTCPADVCIIELGGTLGKDKTMVSPEDHLIPIVVLWDIENCNVPKKAQVEAIPQNIRDALKHMYPATAKATIRTYGLVPALVKEGLKGTGVIHVDTLNRKENAADKMILVNMLCFAIDNPPPAMILLISGDVDFAPAVRELVDRGYTMVIALPSQGTASSDLTTAGTHAWDWPSLAQGKGIVNRRSSPPDLEILKAEMICLFESHGGRIDVGNILSKYTKMFKKQIKLSDYNAPKLVDLFMKMGEPFSVKRNIVSLNMQFDQGSTSATTVGPSGVPTSITDTSFVNMEEYPYGPVEDANVETGMVWNRR